MASKSDPTIQNDVASTNSQVLSETTSIHPSRQPKLSPELRAYLNEQREAILKVYPKAFDPNLTPQERVEMEQMLARSQEGSGLSLVTIMNLVVFGILFAVLGVVLHQEQGVNIFHVIGRFLLYLIDPGQPTSAPTSVQAAQEVAAMTSHSRAAIVDSIRTPDLPLLQMQPVQIVDALPAEDAPKVDLRSEL